jgi:hypothetical protein
MKKLASIFFILSVVACVSRYPSVHQISVYESPDQEILYGMLVTLQESLNSRDVDTWFSLYADDAILTYIKNRPTPKSEVVASVKQQDPRSWKFQIEDVKIVAADIQPKQARIKTILKMNEGGSVRDHPETYYFSKMGGAWRIVKETNP